MYLRLSPYREVLQGVLTSLQVNEGIIKITGKSGAGKSALCSQLFNELEATGQHAVFFLKPPASAVALQNDILDNLNLDPGGNFTRTLTDFLLARTPAQAPLVLIFDDAQQLDQQTFSAIRMLCNIQDQSRALVRVILCGNDELDEKLANPALRAVTQFLNQSFVLPYLSQEQVNDFCQGYWQRSNEDMKPLSERNLQKLFQETRGQPGILHARLNQGRARAEKSDRYRGSDASEAARPGRYPGSRAGWVPALLIIIGLMAVGAAGSWYFASSPEVAEDVSSANTSEAAEDIATDSPVIGVAATAVAMPPAAQPVPEAATNPEPESTLTETTVALASATVEPERAAVEPELAAVEPEELTTIESVDQFIAAWTTSWQNQDVDAYLAHYHPAFAPAQGVTQEAWRAQRRRVIENARNIVITVDAPEFNGEAQDGARIVRFWLNYSAANYADRTLKELLLAPVDGMWRIRSENNLRTERQ